MSSSVPFPRDFVCEHTPAKSRVYAVLAFPDRPNTLKAVLTCTNPLLAQRAASVLSCLAITGGGAMTDTEVENIHADLPAAPAASFREACRLLRDRAWPPADTSPVGWDQVRIPDEEGFEPAGRDEEIRTPTGARLSQLTGKVFRITEFAEYHVYDADRLIHAATADGWTPLSAEGEEDGDVEPDENLLDALMHLVATNYEVPGADAMSRRSTGKLLTVGAGDELADWQQEPVTATFAGGWRLRAQASGTLGGAREDDSPAGPDFATLFPVRSCDRHHMDGDEEMNCDICSDWQITPRTADMLYAALEILSDEAYDDVDEHASTPVTRKNANDWSLFDRLPRITWRADVDWRRQFARACEDLSEDLAAGRWPTPRNNAEEMALHLAIEDAPDCLEMGEDSENERHNALPKHADDYAWDTCSELLFQDHDVLMLFDRDLDGIEDPVNGINQFLRAGDLRPDSWFLVFANEEPRDPNRGFRR